MGEPPQLVPASASRLGPQSDCLQLPRIFSEYERPTCPLKAEELASSDIYDRCFLEGLLNATDSGARFKSKSPRGTPRRGSPHPTTEASPLPALAFCGRGREISGGHQEFFKRLNKRHATYGCPRDVPPGAGRQAEAAAHGGAAAAHGPAQGRPGQQNPTGAGAESKKNLSSSNAKDIFRERQRDACESFRILIFGRVGNEEWQPCDRDRLFERRRGTQAEVETFVHKWIQLDIDESGDVDFKEFLEFFVSSNTDRLLGMRVVRYLINVEMDSEIPRPFDKMPHTCTKEDMMRLLWLKAQDEDIYAMNCMFDLIKIRMSAVPPLPLMSKKRRRELRESFNELRRAGLDARDRGRGLVPYTALADGGLVDFGLAEELRAKYNQKKDGSFDFKEFLEMLCPYGIRAHKGVTEPLNKDGEVVRHVTWSRGECQFSGWMLDSVFAVLKDQYALEATQRFFYEDDSDATP